MNLRSSHGSLASLDAQSHARFATDAEPMPRPPDERMAISAGMLASERSRRARSHYAAALRLAVEIEGMSLVQPRVRPRAIRRTLEKMAPTLERTSCEAAAVNFVLLRGHRALGLFVTRNPLWTGDLVASLEKQSPATMAGP
jgi:hypothetical protein